MFHPIIEYVLHLKGQSQLVAYYCANGLLSAISDNVFVATVYISETKLHFVNVLGAIPNIGMTGQALMDKLTDPHVARADVLATLPQAAAAQARDVMLNLDKLAVAINTGYQHPQCCHSQWSGRVPLPADLGPCTGHSAFLRPDGHVGTALHHHHVVGWVWRRSTTFSNRTSHNHVARPTPVSATPCDRGGRTLFDPDEKGPG